MMHFSWIWMILAGLFWLGFFVLIVLLIIRLAIGVKRGHFQAGAGNTPQPVHPNSKALEILAERYAKGEVDDDEFRKRKEELNKQ